MKVRVACHWCALKNVRFCPVCMSQIVYAPRKKISYKANHFNF